MNITTIIIIVATIFVAWFFFKKIAEKKTKRQKIIKDTAHDAQNDINTHVHVIKVEPDLKKEAELVSETNIEEKKVSRSLNPDREKPFANLKSNLATSESEKENVENDGETPAEEVKEKQAEESKEEVQEESKGE